MCHWPGLRAEHLCRDALESVAVTVYYTKSEAKSR
jgi:hypothetical protein